MTKKQRDELKQVISNQVAGVGFIAKFNWILQIFADYIERTYGFPYSLRGVSKLMERMGMSYTKPTYTIATAETFLYFLHKVLKTYPKENITMILDNARIHHANLLQPFLSEKKRLTFIFLPPYSPQLNVVEGLWKWLKSDVINNVFNIR